MKKTIHLIANAHLDPVWLWKWEEGFAETIHTCRFLVDLMKEHPSLSFTRSSANAYRWIEETLPDLFGEIKRLVKEGRWRVAGPWIVQSDCNLPSGESLVRQSLYGKSYFREKFGIDVRVGYNPDSFGHASQLPQILKKSGIEYYLFCRPDPTEKDLPHVFWWEAPDGSRVLACRPVNHYNSLDHTIEEKIREIAGSFQEGLCDAVCLFGVGNHGGGPTRKTLKIIEKLKKKKDLPTLRYSRLDDFFQRVKRRGGQLPVVREDLQYDARGCYTSLFPIKKMNRLGENRVLAAELLSALTWRLDLDPYPDEMEKIWRDILFNQFHDILPGSSMVEAYPDCFRRLGSAVAASNRIVNTKMWALGKQVKTAGLEGFPILFFNPCPFERREIAFTSIAKSDTFIKQPDVDFFDERGRRVPSQSVQDTNTIREKTLVEVTIPPMGYRVYWWRPSSGKKIRTSLIRRRRSLENAHLFLRLDPDTGGIKTLRLKKENWNSLHFPGAVFRVMEDPGNAWGHFVDSFSREIGHFSCTDIFPGEQGPCMASLRCRLRYNRSEIELEHILYNRLPFVEIRGKIDWREKNRMLKMSFPVNVRDPRAATETPYGYTERDVNGEENPCQRWVDLSGTYRGRTMGVSVVNDGWYGCDLNGRMLNMTVLRSPVFGSFEKPEELDPDLFYDHQALGIHRFRIFILPHRGDWRRGGTVSLAGFLNQPLEYILPLKKEGNLPPSGSFLSVSPKNIVPVVLKKAETGNDLILRLFESEGKNTRGTITIFNHTRRIHVGKNEIQSWRISPGKKRPLFKKVNLLEE